jgi:predicted enzyme related to lactoylglutathione lyase
MHKSKLAGFIIDCRSDDLTAAAQFWGAALGMAPKALPGTEGEKYVRLVDPADALHIEVQKVEHESRVHLDIESDDVEAEVKRLEALGATVVRRVHTWCVMQAPTGQRFCVVRAQSKDFAARANRWGD